MATATSVHAGIESAAPRQIVRWPENVWLVAFLLGLGTAAVFGRSIENDWVYFDDNFYVLKNPQIQNGLTAENIAWAFRPDTFVAANWHPLTLMSHMLDCSLFGLDPTGPHAINVLLHTANTVLLFLVLVLMTGRLWPCALVAALFAWHPLRVESVSWIAERKDVLSTLFWFLTMGAYVQWTRTRQVGWYVAAAAALLLGLLSKPMLVTVPFTLLLLDYWPLGRVEWRGKPAEWLQAWGPRAIEKMPLFALLLPTIWMTLRAQSAQKAIRSAETETPVKVACDVVLSYTEYISLLVWPKGLAVLYPTAAREYELMQIVTAVGALLVVTGLALAWGRLRPYLPVGWFWYLGTLVPVIGFVPFGAHSIADRYTYVPAVGLFVVVAWGLAELVEQRPAWRTAVAAGVVLWLLALAGVTWQQQGYWRNTRTLFERALAVTEKNYIAHHTLGFALVTEYQEQLGDLSREPDVKLIEEAMVHYKQANEIQPKYAPAYYNSGYAQRLVGNLKEAKAGFEAAIEQGSKSAGSWANLGEANLRLGDPAAAEQEYRKALEIDPGMVEAMVGLGEALYLQGKTSEAIARHRATLAMFPQQPLAQGQLARILALDPDAKVRNANEARQLSEAACQATQTSEPTLLSYYAAALAEQGRFSDALRVIDHARVLVQKFAGRDPLLEPLAAQLTQQGEAYSAGRAWHVDPRETLPK
jgi:tetratricopeptide (TPR) repeat protein